MSPPGRVLALLVLVAAVATAPVQAPRAVALTLAIPCAALALARPRLRWLVTRSMAAALAIVALVVPFALAGPASHAVEIALRAGAAALTALALAHGIELAELPGALRRLGVPPVLAGTVHATLWQLANVSNEGRRLTLARRLRGAPGGFGPDVLALLLVRTRARAERVDLALRLRGADAVTAPRARFLLSDVPALSAALGAAVALHVVG